MTIRSGHGLSYLFFVAALLAFARSAPAGNLLEFDSVTQRAWTLRGSTAVTEQLLSAHVDGGVADAQHLGPAPRSSPRSTSARRHIVFLDPRIESYAHLLTAFDPGVEVVLLPSTRDGLEHIADTLAKRQPIDALHLIAHGAPARLQLGATRLRFDTISKRETSLLSRIGRYLSDRADLLIYGCRFGAGAAGRAAVYRLAQLTKADVAASDDLTGHPELGGDWDLEYTMGRIDPPRVLNMQTAAAWRGSLATVTVTSTTDTSDGNTSSIANLMASPGGDGVISLREAMIAANNTPGMDTIAFHISGGGPHTIQPASLLPSMTDPVMIDGSTEPDFTGTPVIELDGTLSVTWGLILDTGSSGSTIRGLVINGFSERSIFILGGSGHHLIAGNYLGTDVTGLINRASGAWGVDIVNGGAGNLIGGSTVADRNVIAGTRGVAINGASISNTVITGNYFGVGSDGATALGFAEFTILQLSDPTNTRIGGTAPGEGNIIAHGSRDGIEIWGGTSAIVGNRIFGNAELGIDLNGDGPTANDVGDGDTGANSLQNFPVLATAVSAGGNTTITGSLNSTANTTFDIHFYSSSTPDSSGHGEGEIYLGSDRVTTNGSGNAAINSSLMASVTGGHVVTATATNPSNHTSEFSATVTVVSNILVVDTTSDVSDGNTSSIANLIANKGADGFISLREAMIATNNTANIGGNPDEIHFNIVGASPHTIQPGSPLPAITEGVVIDGTTEPDFAGPPIIELNGTSVANSGLIIATASSGTTIRGLVINRFGSFGIWLQSGAANTTIAGNYIGLDTSGEIGLGNGNNGINVNNVSGLTIGGATAADRNVIAVSNRLIEVNSGASNVVIQGNYLGVDKDGNQAIGGTTGILLFDTMNTIVGGTGGAANVIGGVAQTGIFITSTTPITVQGNYIGTNAMGDNLGNGSHGIVLLSATAATIGGLGAGEGNVIAFNGQDGIALSGTSTNHSILGNSIHSNSGLGIDLSDNGVTANDVGDHDIGTNNLQNFPVLDAAHTTGTRTAIRGSLNSIASTTFRLEFFANATADGSGHGEGERYLGAREVTTHATTGNAAFTFMLSAAVVAGEFITATATNLSTNDTSEFALNVTAQAGLDSDSDGVLDVAEDRNLDGDNNPATGPALDTDGDGTPDYLDPTDDGAGDAATSAEDPNGNGDPTDDDTDGDGIPDYLDPDDSGPTNDSDSDGVDDDVECPSGTPCTDTDGDGIPNYNDPDHNTLVQNLTLNAMADASGVWIDWTTGWEVDNLGFQVYREVGGVPVQVTPSIIAGSALLTGPGTMLPAGHSYAWHDPAGTAQDPYWLVDVDLDGTRTWHGPIQALPISSTVSASRRTSSPLLARLGRQPARQASARFQPQRHIAEVPPHARVTTPLQSPAWERSDLSPTAVQYALATAPALILQVREPGWYRVSQADLVQAGLDPDIDPRHLQLFAGGRVRPLYVVGEGDGHLDPGDAIEFYGEGLDTPWTNTQAYWLVMGTQLGTRLQQVEAPGLLPVSESFPLTVEQHERSVYIAAIQNGRDENFFGALIGADPIEQVLHLSHLDPASPGEAKITVALHGVSSQIHPVTIKLNDHDVGTLNVSGRTLASGEFTISQRLLRPGANRVTLAGTGAEHDVSVVKSIQLTYWRTYTAEDNLLFCTVPSQQSVSLKGYTTDDIRVFDITDPEMAEELLAPITADGEGYRITVAPIHPGTRTLFATSETQSRSPLSITANRVSTWHRPDQGADLLVIAHTRWLDRLVPLQTLREQQGWSVALVDIQDLYDEWAFGHKDPQAITAFLQHATTHWQTAPRFVLLVGDASFDPRNYLGEGPSDWIPTTWVNTTAMETASDDALADLDGDGLADLAIGRLPVRSAAEADAVVAKLVAYDAAEGNWQGQSLVVTDRPDTFDFARATRPLVQQLSAATVVSTLSVGASSLDDTRRHLYEHLEAGQLLVSYLGHGSIQGWHAEGLLTTSAVYELKNSPYLPVMLSMTCLTGFFHDFYTESVAESLIRAPTGGAVAVWASSGLTHPPAQAEMQLALVNRLLSEEQLTLGEAIQVAKASIADPDVQRTWVLLGDPSLRIKLNATQTPTSLETLKLGTTPSTSRNGGGCGLNPGGTFDPILVSALSFICIYCVLKHAGPQRRL